jgi:predicted  nucleic acid-binding Zn-ribbon protein
VTATSLEFEHQNQSLQQQLQEVRLECEKLERHNSDLQLTLEQFDTQFKSSQEEITRKDIEITELNATIQKFSEKPSTDSNLDPPSNPSAQRQLDDLLKENDSLTAKLSRLETSTLQTELEQLLLEKADLTTEIFDLKSALKRESQSAKRDISALTGQIRRLESEKNGLSEQKQSHEQELIVRETEIKSLRKELQIQFAELQEMKRLLAIENNQNEMLRQQLKQAFSVALLVSETEQQITGLKSSDQQIVVNRNVLTKLKGKVQAIRADLLGLRNAVTDANFSMERKVFQEKRGRNVKDQLKIVEELKRRLGEQENRNAELKEQLRDVAILEANHTKALRLLGEYHCRICVLTNPQRIGIPEDGTERKVSTRAMSFV